MTLRIPKKLKLLTVCLFAIGTTVYTVMTGLWWLFILILLHYVVVTGTVKIIRRFKLRGVVSLVLFTGMGTVILSVVLKIFIFDIYRIPSVSMENTIIKGDIILVNKLRYGPKLYSENTNLLLPRRLPGYGTIARNSIILFSDPGGTNTSLIKRCVGLPGDIVKIVDNQVYVNDKLIDDPENVKYFYLVPVTKDRMDHMKRRINTAFKKKVVVGERKATSILLLELSSQELDSFHHYFPYTLIERKIENRRLQLYPGEGKVNYNGRETLSNYGPVKIPKKGEAIRITKNNFKLFEVLLEKYEGRNVMFDGNNIYIDGNKDSLHIFTHNYYYVMGDHRHNAIDSRYFGPIPDSYIEGDAPLVIFNKYTSRYFKSLN